MLNHDTRLYPHHLDPNRQFAFDQPLAEMNRHPRDQSRWGLKNLGTTRWTLHAPDGAISDIDPGRSAELASGTKINFGAIEGDVRF